MFKLEFDASNKPLAAAMGQALLNYAGAPAVPAAHAKGRELTAEEEAAVLGTKTSLEAAAVLGTKTSLEAAAILNDFDKSVTEGVNEADTSAGTTDTTGEAENLDNWRVPFDAKFCSKAAVPFYASGPDKGQWKRKGGVDKVAYDEWYKAKLVSLIDTTGTNTTDEAGNTAAGGAFGKTIGTDPAATLGTLMTWVSEQQNAGHLDASAVDAAYNRLGYQITDIIDDAALVKRQAVLGALKESFK